MNQKHTLYISYADADKAWVIDFVKNLKVSLRKRLGQIDDNFIWAKYMLSNLESKQSQLEYLENSTYLIAILSPAYINTINMQEIDKFNNLENPIIIEHDKVDRSEKIKDLIGYRFWKKDETEGIRQFSNITCRTTYHQMIDQLARDLVKKISLSNQPFESKKYNVFLSSSMEYGLERNSLKNYLENKGFQILPRTNTPKNELQQANFFIQLGSDDKGNYLYEMAKKQNIPAKRWTNRKQESLPSHIYTADIESFKIIINQFIVNGNIESSNINTGKHVQQQNSVNQQPSSDSTTNDQKIVFINAIEEDREFAINHVQKKLKLGNIESILLPSANIANYPKEIEQELEQNLLSHYAVIIICDKAPPMWVYQQIQHCNAIRHIKRQKEGIDDFKVIAVFNKPPPNKLDLGIHLHNFKVWNYPTNCIAEFIESLNA